MIWAERQEERINTDVSVGLRLIAAIVVSSISALVSGIFILLVFRDWFYAIFTYIVVGQIALVTILMSTRIRSWIVEGLSHFDILQKPFLQQRKEDQAKLGLDQLK